MTKSQFRMTVVASIVLGFGSIVAVLLLNPPLPAELDRWVLEQSYGFGPFEWFSIALLMTYLVGTVGLLFFARWSRGLYAFGVFSVTLVTLFSGPSVTTAMETFVGEVGILLDGFILSLAYFSDARRYFEDQPQTSVAPAT